MDQAIMKLNEILKVEVHGGVPLYAFWVSLSHDKNSEMSGNAVFWEMLAELEASGLLYNDREINPITGVYDLFVYADDPRKLRIGARIFQNYYPDEVLHYAIIDPKEYEHLVTDWGHGPVIGADHFGSMHWEKHPSWLVM